MTSKINFYLIILERLKENETLSKIASELNISKQKLNYYTTILKKLGFIEKKGYGVWEVKRSKKEDLEHAINWKDKKIRGHAFIWQVKLSKKFDWINILNQKQIPYNLIRGYTPRIWINNRKIWLGHNSIIIYEAKSFFGSNAIESRKYAVFELLELLKILSKYLGINLGKYYFKPTREHYALIKNELARQCNDKGEKIIVRDALDGEWLWIDNSESLGELETGGTGFTKDRAGLNLDVQNWWNKHKETNFKVTPDFVLESLKGMLQVQEMHSHNIVKHQKVLDEMLLTLKSIRDNLNPTTKTKPKNKKST